MAQPLPPARLSPRARLLWILFAASALATAWTESEIIWLFLGSGVVTLFVRFPPKGKLGSSGSAGAWLPLAGMNLSLAAVVTPSVPTWPLLGRIALYFAEAGSFVFGSGLAIVPFMHGGVVNQFHWLTERQFLDAVAIAMITPGARRHHRRLHRLPHRGPARRVGRIRRRVPPMLPVRGHSCALLPALRRQPARQSLCRRRDRRRNRRDRRRGVRAWPSGADGRRRRTDRACDLVPVQPREEAS